VIIMVWKDTIQKAESATEIRADKLILFARHELNIRGNYLKNVLITALQMVENGR